MFFESLLEGTADESDAVYGLIAESMEYPVDRSHVVFNMRPQATFSDGTPLTSADVVFSFETLRDKGLPSFRAVIQKQVERAEALGPHRVRFTFKEDVPTRDLPQLVGGLPIFSKAYYDSTGADFEASTLTPAVGSGPYVLDSIDVGQQIIYRRNPDYWGKDLPSTVGGTISTVSGSNITPTTTVPSKASRPATTPSGTRRPRKSGQPAMISRPLKKAGPKRTLRPTGHWRQVSPSFSTEDGRNSAISASAKRSV